MKPCRSLNYINEVDRTSYRVAHRQIPLIPPQEHCRMFRNVPQKYVGREEFAIRQMYRTTSGVHAKLRGGPAPVFHDRYRCSSAVHYMNFADEKMEKHSHGSRKQMMSETKENFQYSPLLKFDVHLSCDHSMLPDNNKYRDFGYGYNIWLDPHNTTNKIYHSYPKIVGKYPALNEIHQTNKIIPNRLIWTPSAFMSETKKNYTPPYQEYNRHPIVI